MSARAREIDAFKGLLICLIILGHNTLLYSYEFLAVRVLYNFHVASFLLLPFLFFGDSVREYRFRDRAVRYLVPHFSFFAIACAAYFALFVDKNGDAIAQWLASAALAALISSFHAYRSGVGFGFFWFLPALFTIVLLRTAWFRGGPTRRGLILGATLAVHLLLGVPPSWWIRWVPWGLPISTFLFPIALGLGELWRRGVDTRAWFVGSWLVFAACIYLGLRYSSWAGLGGDPLVFGVDRPLNLLLHDAYLASGFLALLLLCFRLPGGLTRALAYLGERSLFVFLAHPFVFHVLTLVGIMPKLQAALPPLIAIAVSFALTLAATLPGYPLLRSMPRLHDLVFPRSWAQWRRALGAKDATPG